MPLTSITFDTPKTSSVETVHVTGTVAANNTGGYVRVAVTVTNTSTSRNDAYYTTATFGAKATEYQFHQTFDLAISPRRLSADTVKVKYNFSYTAKE